MDGTPKQATFEDESPEYAAFVAKFRPKKTTDDCYTPAPVFDAVADWVSARYRLDRSRFVRPFWPGGDYQSADYPPEAVVVDNPPFSITTEIVAFYLARKIPFFLFAPYLSNLGIGRGDPRLCHVVAPADVVYENGAKVATSFVTSLEPGTVVLSAPDLCRIVKDANARNLAATVKPLPAYVSPDAVITSASLGYLAKHGAAFSVRPDEAAFLRALDAQRAVKKEIFGGGFLLSTNAAQRLARARREAHENAARPDERGNGGETAWTLSPRERDLQRALA